MSVPDDRAHNELLNRLRHVRRVLNLSRDPLDSPFDLRFMPMDGWTYRDAWVRYLDGRRDDWDEPGVTVYVHIPFCATKCSYCVLSSRRTPGRQMIEEYVEALRYEIQLWKPVFAETSVSTIHVGGGTPSILRSEQLDALLGDVRSAFRPSPSFRMGVEFHPSSTTRQKLEVLRQHGVDRVSFGVQSFTPEVLKEVDRSFQSVADVTTAVELARSVGIPAVNLDLLAGLPGETEESFDGTIRQALKLEPDSLTVNRFLVENSPLSAFGYSPDREETVTCDAVLKKADRTIRELRPPVWPDRILDAAAYGAQYIWDASGRAQNYFQEDMMGPASVLTIGHGALGHVHGTLFCTTAGTPEEYVEQCASGEPPAMLTSPLSPRWEMAFYAADRACRGDLDEASFLKVFGAEVRHVFQREMSFLRWSRLLNEADGHWSKPMNRSFQFSELFAFLLFSTGDLRGEHRRLSSVDAARPETSGKVLDFVRVRTGVPKTVQAAPTSDDTTDQFALQDSESVSEQELFDSFMRARSANMARIVLWTDGSRFTSQRVARAAVEAGLTDLVLRYQPSESGDPVSDPNALAEVSRTIESFQGTILRRLVVCLSVKDRGDSRIAGMVTALADVGVRDVLLELEEGLTIEAAIGLRKLARSRNVQLEVVHGNPDSRVVQYRLSDGEFPSSLFWCRIALKAVRANRRAAAPKARTNLMRRPVTVQEAIRPFASDEGGNAKSQMGFDHINQPKPRPVKR